MYVTRGLEPNDTRTLSDSVQTYVSLLCLHREDDSDCVGTKHRAPCNVPKTADQ